MPSPEKKAKGAYGLGRLDLRNGEVKYLVTDTFGFGACLVFYNRISGEVRFFEPSVEPTFQGLWGLLGVVDVPSEPEPVSDLVADLIAYEGGEMDALDVPRFFQRLIDEGWTGKLQGHYGRTAATLISCGLCHEPSQNETSVV